jgi:FkbM family methyltransferase
MPYVDQTPEQQPLFFESVEFMTVTAFQQANQLLREGKLEAAVVVYRRAIEQNPNSYLSYQNLGETLGKLGRLDEAVQVYRKAIELKPAAGWLQKELELLLERLEKPLEAKASPNELSFAVQEKPIFKQKVVNHTTTTEVEPKSAENYYCLGEEKLKEGKLEEAIADYHNAISLDPNKYVFYHRLGNALAGLSKLNEAINAYNQALKLNPNYAWSYYHLGIALQTMGKVEEARSCYQKAINIQPNLSKASEKLAQLKNNFYSQLTKKFQNASCRFEELDLLLLFHYQTNNQPILVDVGAHVGYVSRQFADKGWKIIAFEPEPDNRHDLENNLKKYPDVTIIPKAVSNQDDQSVVFYVSSEYWGIHSLKPFHETHQPKLTVQTTRLDTALKKLNITDVTLLKIDTEGADFLVLQGFDFNQIKPEIVMCEFADDRSVPNFGCSHHDIAKYMREQGYEVFISEWASITEYGRKGQRSDPHYFLQCTRYPLNHDPAWGNLIFVRNDRVTEFEKTLSSYLESFYEKREQIILQVSNERLIEYKDKHKGERCVIIGNGPSLNKMDLSFLKNEITFGVNRIYLGFEKWDFVPTYYVAINRLVIEQSANQICSIPGTKFISNRGLPYLKPQKDIVFVRTHPYPGVDFSSEATQGLNEGSTVTYAAMQLAYYMGFKTVVLIGVDHHFVTPGVPHTEVISEGDDPNHFHPDYFGKGVKWQLPDLQTSERSYKIALAKFWLDDRIIIDATVEGRCPVFCKKNYKDLFF